MTLTKPQQLSSSIYVHLLSTSIYDLVLIYVCHFHHHFQWQLLKFDHYRDTRAFILDPCIQGIFYSIFIVITGMILWISSCYWSTLSAQLPTLQECLKWLSLLISSIPLSVSMSEEASMAGKYHHFAIICNFLLQ